MDSCMGAIGAIGSAWDSRPQGWAFESLIAHKCVCKSLYSSAGRASDWRSEGRVFDPRWRQLSFFSPLHCQVCYITFATAKSIHDCSKAFIYINIYLLPMGFEPMHPKIIELKSTALDQLGHESTAYVIWCKYKGTTQQKGVKGESNSRPLAPKARIMPLDHWPLWYIHIVYNIYLRGVSMMS